MNATKILEEQKIFFAQRREESKVRQQESPHVPVFFALFLCDLCALTRNPKSKQKPR
jgi:hypothetical protein